MNKMTFTERNYAPVPFWLWNSDQNEAELTRQLHCFYEAGFQAVAIHARTGNKTEYMSARWLELVRHACNEAKKIGLKIWLYDEEDWPSGPVGGRLPAKGPEFRQKLLRFQRMSWEDARSNPDLYAAFPVSDPGILLENENAEKFPPQQEVLAFLKGFCEYNMPDYLKRRVCDEFMKMTHEKYAAELTGLMPEILNTVYTDDLHILLDESGTPTFSWTDEFDSEFEKEHHYSFRHKLSCLVEDLPDAGKVRIDYRKTLSRMFRENFVAPMNDWAMQHKLHFTGHISGDEGPLLLEIAKITDPFEFLIAEEIPGVDDYLLGRHDGRYLAEATNHLTFDRTLHKQKGFSLIHTCKKAVSVASQFKNGRCSSEILSSLGWGMPFYALLAQTHAIMGCGINLLVPHACYYSTGGPGKFDHPGSHFIQQPYFDCYKTFLENISRSTQLLNRGRANAEVLIIYPLRTAHMKINGQIRCNCQEKYTPIIPCNDSEENFFQPMTDMLNDLVLKLSQRQIDFEFTTETLLEQGKISADGTLQLGDARYSSVILPECLTISPNTRTLLQQFHSAGGKIITIGHRPDFIDGIKPTQELLPQSVPHFDSVAGLPENLFKSQLPLQSINGSSMEQIMCHTRLVDGQKEFFLVNFSGQAQDLQFDPEKLELFDPESKKIIQCSEGVFRLPSFGCCHLLPIGSLDCEEIQVTGSGFHPLFTAVDRIALTDWKITPQNKNFLCIDQVSRSETSQEWFFNGREVRNAAKGEVFTSSFQLDHLPESAVLFKENHLEILNINGQSVPDAKIVCWVDNSLQGCEINRQLKLGCNTVCFKNHGDTLEPIYLAMTGAAVQLDGKNSLVKAAGQLKLGDLAQQGYPFYWGKIEYQCDFKLKTVNSDQRIYLNIPEAEGVVELFVNDIPCGVKYSKPDGIEFDITLAVKNDSNTVKLLLANTAVNFYGPHRAINLKNAFNTAWHPEIPAEAEDGRICPAVFGILSEPEIIISTP